MSDTEKSKQCPQYCPFLMANGTFCELFKRALQAIHGITQKCQECTDPEQRKNAYKSLGLSIDKRAQIWEKALSKHNEIELGKKRKEEGIRKNFAAFLEDKFGSRPPLEGNAFLNNLVINLFMVLDNTERNMMMSLLSGRNGDALLNAIDKAPKDDSLLRNIRREIDSQYRDYVQTMQREQNQNINTPLK